MKMRSFPLLTLLLLLAACSSAAPPENETSPPITPNPATLSPLSTADSGQLPAAGDTSVVYGRNDDGTFFHGAADAPVTLIDYSDFL